MKLFPFLAFLFGLCFGSFLNVVIYRLPRGLSVIIPRSFCPTCGHELSWYENVPLLSFFLQKGRCRACGTKISMRYPLVEFLSGALAFYFVAKFDLTLTAFIFYVFSMFLLAASFIDLEHKIIPDELSLGGLLVGLVFSPFNPLVDPKGAFLGALCGAGGFYLLGEFYFWLRGREGLGGGDYKLLAMIGSFLGLERLLSVVFAASLSGVFGVLFIALIKRQKISGTTSIPFGPFLALGALLVLLFPEKLATVFSPSIY